MRKVWENLKFIIKNRFVVFGIFLAAFIVAQYWASGCLLPSTDTKDLWFYSGIFMVLFSILFIEPYYTSPKNVITNVIPLLLVFVSIKHFVKNQGIWWGAVGIFLFLLAASILAMALEDNDKSPEDWKNRVSNRIKDIVVFIGQGRVMYSAVFGYFLLTNYSLQSGYVIIFFIIWFAIISIDPKSIHGKFWVSVQGGHCDQVGEIFGVQARKIFLVKLFEDRKGVKKFDIVKFRYSMQDDDLVLMGIVFDTYLLNREKWAKILQLADTDRKTTKLEKNMVYKIENRDELENISRSMKIDNFVGVIIEGTSIGKIKFEYSKRNDDLQEGDLLELCIGKKRLFYQVIAGTTEKEKLEARNETGFIIGEAVQLGEWQNHKLSFQKFGWVPSINTPIFKANTSDITPDVFSYPNYKLGIIPGTSLPSVINLHDAMSHHIALLGVTGAGKSYLAMEMIRELAQDTKVICVDLTGEWKDQLASLNPSQLIDTPRVADVEATMAQKETAFRSKNSSDVLKYKTKIQATLDGHIKSFAESGNNLAVFELPDLSNTSFILEFTQMFLEGVFSYAKQTKTKKICIVLEEAHTVIPETTFLGDLGDYSSNKGLVSKIGQIALQGRKYGVGFIVIAQRTANVSKTVLTQCNTVICFQAFDETSFTFLGNYIGKDMVQALPNLKQYHAVVAGKAIKSNMPMIIDLTRARI